MFDKQLYMVTICEEVKTTPETETQTVWVFAKDYNEVENIVMNNTRILFNTMAVILNIQKIAKPFNPQSMNGLSILMYETITGGEG